MFPGKTAMMFLLILFCIPPFATCGETDNYYAWGKQINDSAHLFNIYLNEHINKILTEINADHSYRKQTQCPDVVLIIMEELGTTRFVFKMAALNTRIERWAESNPAVDRVPPLGTTEKEYVAHSLFAPDLGPLEKQFVSIDPTINIGGIYFGTDKLSHFLGSGYLYYKTYLRTLEKTHVPIAALNAAIEKGCKMEAGILGMKTTGIFSFADLEANYQGLIMALDLCRSDRQLILKSGQWVLSSPLDIRQ